MSEEKTNDLSEARRKFLAVMEIYTPMGPGGANARRSMLEGLAELEAAVRADEREVMHAKANLAQIEAARERATAKANFVDASPPPTIAGEAPAPAAPETSAPAEPPGAPPNDMQEPPEAGLKLGNEPEGSKARPSVNDELNLAAKLQAEGKKLEAEQKKASKKK